MAMITVVINNTAYLKSCSILGRLFFVGAGEAEYSFAKREKIIYIMYVNIYYKRKNGKY